jgi:hypothetical protein
MNQFADAGTIGRRTADEGKTLQQINVVQDCVAETLRRTGKVGPGVVQDVFKVR